MPQCGGKLAARESIKHFSMCMYRIVMRVGND